MRHDSVTSRTYKGYVLSVLALVYMLNFLDRGLMMLLLQPIKEDLDLSDTQLGFVTGIAFGLFYATLGIPMARWADRGNRVNVTSFAIGLWGLTVMACLFVTNYIQLVCARIAAAVGEAGCKPPTYSLVGDYFPHPAERTRAMAVYLAASPLSSLISFVVGGWLSEIYGWRLVFFLAGIPGLLLALVVKLTVREPRLEKKDARKAPRTSLRGVVVVMWRLRSLRHLSLGLILLYTIGLGLSPWYAAFMARSHGMGTAELGLWLGLLFSVAGAVGVLAGGYIATRWFPSNDRAQMRLNAVVVASLILFFIAFLTAPQKYGALIALAPIQMAICFVLGPAYTLIQRLVADEIRATTMTMIMLFANIIGMGLGPQVVGILSDLFARHFEHDGLRYAMLIMSLLAPWAAYHFWKVGVTAELDLQAASERRRVRLEDANETEPVLPI